MLGIATLVLLLVRLSDARGPLRAATASARATVEAVGQPPDDRGVRLSIADPAGTRTGVLVLPRPATVAVGTEIDVAFDPHSPVDRTDVHVPGDDTYRRAQDLTFGLVAVAARARGDHRASPPGASLAVARLRRAPVAEVTAGRVVVRQGLLVRSWLELVTSGGVRWLPVYWAPELARLAPDTALEVRGDPVRGRGGAAGGRRRGGLAVGTAAQPAAARRAAGDRSGRGAGGGRLGPPAAQRRRSGWSRPRCSACCGRSSTTAARAASASPPRSAAGVLWWLPQLLGSDPAPPDRD